MTTDDNAVDMPVKTEDEPTSIGLTNNNDRIPILDDDDDVIVLPTEEPIIEEIPDDDDQIAKDTTATTIELANGVAVDSDGLNSAGVVIASQDTGISTQPDSDENKGLLHLFYFNFEFSARQIQFQRSNFPNRRFRQK